MSPVYPIIALLLLLSLIGEINDCSDCQTMNYTHKKNRNLEDIKKKIWEGRVDEWLFFLLTIYLLPTQPQKSVNITSQVQVDFFSLSAIPNPALKIALHDFVLVYYNYLIQCLSLQTWWILGEQALGLTNFSIPWNWNSTRSILGTWYLKWTNNES